jgi:hypothetical protein
MSEDKISTHELVAIFGKEIPAEAFTLVAKPGRLTTSQLRDRLHRIADGKDEEAFDKQLDHAELIIENLVYDFPHRKAQLLESLRRYVGMMEDGEFDDIS